jgi:RNA polymerase sigma factor (sigma-70 family)
MQVMDDLPLLREYAASNSESAFETLVSRYAPLVYASALRQTRDPHLAEEVTQAVFIILAKKAGRIGSATILSGWLFKATRFVALAHTRTAARRHRYEQEAAMPPEDQTPAPDPLWEQIVPLLDEAMAQLSEKDRQALLLRYFENKTLAEIGSAFGAGEDAARMRINRALEKLHRYFTRHGVASTAALIAETISVNSAIAVPTTLIKSVTVAAVAHGATGGSTLILIKGALKLMAWTKLKLTVVAGAILLLAAGTTTVVVHSVSAARTRDALANMQGSWEGTLSVDQAQLRVVLRIFKTNDTVRAELDSIDQGGKGIAVTKISAGPNSIHAEAPAIFGSYAATLNADRTELSGYWKQLNHTFPLSLKRTAEADQVEGTLAENEYAPNLNLRIAEPTPGTFHAQVDSVDQGAQNLPIPTMTYSKPAVRFEMPGINGSFEGTVNGRDDEIAGTWTQMGKKFPLTFARAAQTAPASAATEKDYGQGAPNQVQGHWKGAVDVNHIALHIVFHVALMSDGAYSATMDSPDQGARSIPATSAAFNYPDLKMEWKGLGGVFAGKLAKGRLVGAWSQGKVSLPLQLDRIPAQ